MIERACHHSQPHTQEDGPGGYFAIAEENALLDIVREKQRMQVDGRWMADSTMPENPHLDDAKTRLGPNYPDMKPQIEAEVAGVFQGRRSSLATVHPRHNHEHAHQDDGCSRPHGPVRRHLEKLESGIQSRISSRVGKAAVAFAFRGWSLIMCPGDDLAASALPIAAAFNDDGEQQAHEHPEHKAVLPRRPRIDFETGRAVVSLPADMTVGHDALGDTAGAHVVREHIADIIPEPPQPTKRQAKALAKGEADYEARWQRWVAKQAVGDPVANPLTKWARRMQSET